MGQIGEIIHQKEDTVVSSYPNWNLKVRDIRTLWEPKKFVNDEIINSFGVLVQEKFKVSLFCSIGLNL